MIKALADIGVGAWSVEQKRSLRAIISGIGDVLTGRFLPRVAELTQPLSMADLPLTMEIPFPERPRAIMVLSATAEDGTVISLPAVRWEFTPSTTSASISITDIDLLDTETYQLDILVVRA